MHILMERKIPFSMTLSIVTHTIEAHSALSDLTKEERNNIEYQFTLLMIKLENLMYTRRIDLGKSIGRDRG